MTDQPVCRVCTHCLVQLLYPHTWLDIRWTGENWTAERDMARFASRLADKVAAIREAWQLGQDVYINGQPCRPPVTTWQGDPVCESHLGELSSAARGPQTVRMAQWRAGR